MGDIKNGTLPGLLITHYISTLSQALKTSHLTFCAWLSIPTPEIEIVLLKHFPDFFSLPCFLFFPPQSGFIYSPFLAHAATHWPRKFRGRLGVVQNQIPSLSKAQGAFASQQTWAEWREDAEGSLKHRSECPSLWSFTLPRGEDTGDSFAKHKCNCVDQVRKSKCAHACECLCVCVCTLREHA